MFIDALVLGTSTGLYCATTCAPLILPFIFSEKIESAKKNAGLISLFMAGRLIGYIITGFLLGALGAYAVDYLDPDLAHLFRRITYPAAGVFMLLGGILLNAPHWKICKIYKKFYRPGRNSLVLGLITGFSLCPPFFAAAARVFGQHSSFGGALYFFLFFLGSSIYFLPLFGVFIFKKHIDKIQMIARVAMVLIGVYYIIFLGILG